MKYRIIEIKEPHNSSKSLELCLDSAIYWMENRFNNNKI